MVKFGAPAFGIFWKHKHKSKEIKIPGFKLASQL
jgi:hypothetical protein